MKCGLIKRRMHLEEFSTIDKIEPVEQKIIKIFKNSIMNFFAELYIYREKKFRIQHVNDYRVYNS